MKMKTLFRTFAIALLATSVSGFAQVDDEKNANNDQTMSQTEKKQDKKSHKQAKPAKTKTNSDQEKAYDPTAGIWG
jgi:hypothetical protein